MVLTCSLGELMVDQMWQYCYIYIYIYILGGTRVVMVIIVRKEYGDSGSNPEQSCFISYCTKNLVKGMHQTILPPIMG